MIHDLQVLLRWLQHRAQFPIAAILDSRTLQSTTKSGGRAGYDGHKRKKGSGIHLAVDTLGHLLALCVTPANAQDRAHVAEIAAAIQTITSDHVTLAYVDQGYTGQTPGADAAALSIVLEVVKLTDAKRGFVLLPRRWVVEHCFAWASRFRRLVRDYERLPQKVTGLHFVPFACLMLHQLIILATQPRSPMTHALEASLQITCGHMGRLTATVHQRDVFGCPPRRVALGRRRLLVRSVRLVNPVGCRGTPRWAAPPALGVMRRRQARTHHIRSSRWMGGVEGQLDLSIPTTSRVLYVSSMPRWSPPANGRVLAGHVAPASILHCSQAEAAMLAPKSAKSSSRGASAPPGEAVTTSGSWHLVILLPRSIGRVKDLMDIRGAAERGLLRFPTMHTGLYVALSHVPRRPLGEEPVHRCVPSQPTE